MQIALDILRGFSAYFLVLAAGGAIMWLTIPGFAGPLSPEIKMRAFTAVLGGGVLFAALVVGGIIVAINWRS